MLKQHYYLSKQLGFNYTIQYKSDASNAVADALSRTPPWETGQFLILSMSQFDFLDDLRRTLHANPKFQALLSKVRANPSNHPDRKWIILSPKCVFDL